MGLTWLQFLVFSIVLILLQIATNFGYAGNVLTVLWTLAWSVWVIFGEQLRDAATSSWRWGTGADDSTTIWPKQGCIVRKAAAQT